MNTARLTERIEIQKLSTTTVDSGIVQQSYETINIVYASILNDAANESNQNVNTSYNRGTTINDSVRFYLRYLPLTYDLKLKKQFKITWNDNEYFVTSIKHVGRTATIIQVSATV